jgi:hypothetical protein
VTALLQRIPPGGFEDQTGGKHREEHQLFAASDHAVPESGFG